MSVILFGLLIFCYL